MKQKDKQLLLQDLCSRLPYGVKININSCIEEQNQMQLFDVNLEIETIGVKNEKWAFRAIPIVDDEDKTKVIKPYLRSMSKLTDKEVYEWHKITSGQRWITFTHAKSCFNWLNKHHVDYRGLIKKGLALEAPKGMYKF